MANYGSTPGPCRHGLDPSFRFTLEGEHLVSDCKADEERIRPCDPKALLSDSFQTRAVVVRRSTAPIAREATA
jgi:hypothetical protein